jgi:hypothetical protein
MKMLADALLASSTRKSPQSHATASEALAKVTVTKTKTTHAARLILPPSVADVSGAAIGATLFQESPYFVELG